MIEMNDASQRAMFAIFAMLIVSGGLAYAAVSGPARVPSPALAATIPGAAAFKSELRADGALALDGDYGCAGVRRPDDRRVGARAAVDCD